MAPRNAAPRSVTEFFRRFGVHRLIEAAEAVGGGSGGTFRLINLIRNWFPRVGGSPPITQQLAGRLASKGLELANAVIAIGQMDPFTASRLKDIPITPGLQIPGMIDNRIQYTFQVRMRAEGGGPPRFFHDHSRV